MSIPKEPRQIMINLMYLVLTALLALNVSNEILNAFRVLSASINKSNESINFSTNEVYNQIVANEAQKGQAERVHPYRVKADQVKKTADDMVAYLHNWVTRVVNEAGGWEEKDSTIPKRQDNIDATTDLLVDKGGGDSLKRKIDEVRSLMLSVLKPNDQKDIAPLMALKVDSMKPDPDNNPKGDWSRGYFEHMPTMAAKAMFSKFENDVRSSEQLVIKKLYEEAHLSEIKFDTTAAIAVPTTTYALEGDKIEASILIAAFNKDLKPTVSVQQGGGSTKPAANGVVPWETIAKGTGLQTVRGTIHLDQPNGTPINLPWKFEYVVGSTGASLQLDKMNVLYIGVDNPVTVSAAGYSVQDVSLNLPSSITQSGSNGKYVLRPTQPGKDMPIDIMAKSKDGKGASSKVATLPVRVKRIPDPVPLFANKNGGFLSAAIARAQFGPLAVLKDFDFDARFRVVSFEFSWLPKGKELIGPKIVANSKAGCKFDDSPEVSKMVGQLKPGDKIFIDRIKAQGPDGTIRDLGTLFFTLN
jgi:gliding motility-associated protein GldM